MAPMRRKSQGSIRSPHVKRNIQSQVTFEGWLFKLEGGALKQWKQRWCALVDFCLFFYKAPHEEKVISSILLPSYKINPCSTDDKISKKFAFKAEHQNMKTYYFATEDKESMKKWMNAMSLATIMQNSENHISAMCSYDDDDSGFTSYRSRYHSNRSSSVHNTSTTSEPLKQRSNSCGDRVGEMYLGSDDKYPNLYKSTSSQLCKMSPAQDIPRKQPLYANAPPKPRRLTQTDGFTIHPSNCYDSQQSNHVESSQYNAAITSTSRYVNQENPMQCLPINSAASSTPYVHSVAPYLDNDLNQSAACQNLSNVYKNKPPRPRSADFLERDNECTTPPSTSQYWETRQPQRPKSSLECYNHIADCEDYDFDDYRDAIRMQADNLYSNKNIMKNRHFLESQKQIENITKSDPRLNACYGSRPYFSNDTVPSSYPQMCTKEICNDQLLINSTSDPQHKTHTESKHSSKPSHNESMQRLLEWKQRMLQSPLSRRNHLHSISSDASSANSSKQADYYRQSVNHSESYNQYHHLSGQDRNLSYQNQNVASLRHEILETCNQYDCTTGEEELDYLNKEDRWEKQPVVPETDEKNNQHIVISDTADTLYQKNILYCVDSENNEILLSYDTSPTSSSAPVPFHSSHYPPQMHSFSTLPNVNDIGIDPTLVGEQSTKKSQPMKSKHHKINQDSSSVGIEKQITYSSDDEDDVIGESDLKETPKEITTESLSEERYFDERFQSPSPDYVNIGAMYRDMDPVSTQGMCSSDFVFRSSVEINQAVLKPLEQVSKNKQSLTKPDITENLAGKCYSNNTFHSIRKSSGDTMFKMKENAPRGHSDNFFDEVECDIKREDYYRASQIFYSSIRNKNKLAISPNKNTNGSHPSNSENGLQIPSPENLETKSFKKIDDIDKDIGLPLPANRMSPELKVLNKTSDICVTKSGTSNDSINYKAENFQEKTQSETDGLKKDEVCIREIIKSKHKKNLSYEEMRGQLLRKREAPPPNIVQERIKKFETVEKNEENKKVPSTSHSKLLESGLHCNKFVSRSFSKRNRLKNSRSKSQKWILHSDSEAVALDESDASSDDLTMKSAPILLSPLSSVLADLRKTADSDKEKVVKQSLRFDAENGQEKSNHSKLSNDFTQNAEDAVYLPMYGIKAIKEPEYVTMSGSKLSPDSSKSKMHKYSEEHVYNEPFSPPPSFLHDVYGKQKAKLFQYQMDSSSDDDSLTENIYEKPIQRFPIDNSRSSSEHLSKTAQETHFVLMNSMSCSNVTSFGQSESAENPNHCSGSYIHKSKPHHYGQAHISVSVPDLLQLQEIKDSDASDADDEASRDFDAAVSSDNNFYNATSSAQTEEESNTVLQQDFDQCYTKNSNPLLQNESSSEIKPMPSCDANASENMLPILEAKHSDSKNNIDDNEKVTHVRKLRVYTKGKKPETPRIFSVPFNIDEVEQSEASEKNEIKKSKYSESTYFKYQADQSSDISLSENVAYVSRSDFDSNNDSMSLCDVSYAPDIISSIKEEDRVSDNSFSKSSTSAPYYYSDLYAGYGLNFSAQLPQFKQHDLPYVDKTSPPKSSTSLLNNIRPKSPCAKNDIGRKVNNINTETKEKPIFNDKSTFKYIKDETTKSNIKHSLDVFQASESKYLDAEKNKYEAGSTLEKTRPSSGVLYFKHRASTPDLNLCEYKSNEPVYENLLFQSKRLSQSLEEIPSASELLSNGETKERSSPVYENIEFFNKFEMASQVQKCGQLSNCDSLRSFADAPVSPKSKTYFINVDQSIPSLEDKSLKTQNADSQDTNFLDQDVLRHVSRQHFYPKESRTNFSANKSIDTWAASSQIVTSPLLTYESRKESCSYEITSGRVISALEQQPKYKGNDSDSTSDVTSSCDEASAESDNRYRPLYGRGSSACLYDSVSVPDITSKEAMQLKKLVQQSNGLMYRGKRLSVSAGDLLGKTHEELVLLLIQLRRNQSKILKAKDKLESKIKKERILQIGSDQTSEHYEELCNQIMHLEKQYEVTQPLVTLVDNMVKLGSLYGSSNRRSLSLPVLDCAQNEVPSTLSSNINVQQTSILSKLLKEEKDLQKQISEISKSEKYMQNETHNLSVLHQDKEMLEHTLFGMRNKILDHQDRPAELQKLRKQQRMIEKELIRVKRLLSTSAKKIEDATCKNDQMEQEILHLRQILQQALKTGSTEMKSQHNRADLEAELARLQSVLDELANHRHEISNTVEKLKNEASTTWSKGAEVRASPTGVAGSAPLPLRKKHHCMYLETDLDTMVTRDLAVMYDKDMDDTPVYANAEEISLSNEESPFYDAAPAKCSSTLPDPETCSLQDINEADERMKRFYGILPKEKPSEIKTVRIVKRQSERRSRERDKKKVSYDDQSSVWIMEEPDLSSDDYLEAEESNVKKLNVPQINRPSSINLSTSGGRQHALSAHERLFGSNTMPKHGSLSQIHSARKPKRRHYTVSGYQYMLDPQFAQYFSERPRSRDDVDMERCLRTANTPDIVRSTIKRNEIFDDKIIERELGLPQKIEIPERYVEVEPEQLSATEKLRRSLKAENICKMLSETTTSYEDVVERRNNSPEALHQKLSEEKRKRAHLLSLNQALAREVVERSKVVAVFATLEHMMKKPLTPVEEDLSPMAPLPITQQRYNFLT